MGLPGRSGWKDTATPRTVAGILSVLLSSAEASLKPEGKELRGWCSEISVLGCRGRCRMALVGVGVEK